MFGNSEIRAGGEYLLSVLATEGNVTYSRFYNCHPETAKAVADGVWSHFVSLPVEERGELRESSRAKVEEDAHVYLDFAAHQLDDLGVVRVTMLDDTELVDGERDFRIELTARGERFLKGGETFRYRNPRSGFDASKASCWLIDFAYYNADDPLPFEFGSVADVGQSEIDVTVTDNSGNEYGFGTRPYAWAFEVSLWHHVRKGNIALTFPSREFKAVWDRFLSRYPNHLFQHDEFPQELRAVRYRVTPKVLSNPDSVRHVGWIGGE